MYRQDSCHLQAYLALHILSSAFASRVDISHVLSRRCIGSCALGLLYRAFPLVTLATLR